MSLTLSEAELEEVYADAVERDQRLADLLLIDAWTGLRWSELRSIRVRDFIEVRCRAGGPARRA